MDKIFIFDYMKRSGILGKIGIDIVMIPQNIDDLLNMLDLQEINFWSYAVEDKDEIKDISNTVLVYDFEGNERYFELTETEQF